MPRSGYLFAILTCLGVFGTAGIMIVELLRGERVSAEPLTGTPVHFSMSRAAFSVESLKSASEKKIKEAVPEKSVPPTAIAEPAPAPALSAKSALIVDRASGARLYEKNAEERVPIASLTKLLTAIAIVDDAPHWLATSTITNAEGEGRNFLEAGDIVTLRDLLFTSLVGSSNSATEELAGAVTPKGAWFPAKMRLKGAELGLSSLFIDDVAGLSLRNVSTASDIAKLFSVAIARPIIREALQEKDYGVKTEQGMTRRVTSTNWLFSRKVTGTARIVGGKTGYLPEAGFNFAALFSDANGREVLVVVLGASDHYARFTEAEHLAEWAYGNFIFP